MNKIYKASTLLFKDDSLRLNNNPALVSAYKLSENVFPIFVIDQNIYKSKKKLWWITQSISDLQENLHSKGSNLTIREGNVDEEIIRLCKEVGSRDLFLNHSTLKIKEEFESNLEKNGIQIHKYFCNGFFLPELIENKSGKRFKMFTPFYKECIKKIEIPIIQKCPKLGTLKFHPPSIKIEKTSCPFEKNIFSPGESGALKALKKFEKTISQYAKNKDFPIKNATSKLSPHISFGEISVWQILDHILKVSQHGLNDPLIRQLFWREFSYYILFHFKDNIVWEKTFPMTPHSNWKQLLSKWKNGETGFPMVDAGMRELNQTGWMHNRSRMIVASFLTKDILLHWKFGADYFDKMLFDADIANNLFGWQWCSGFGTSVQPFFRIFNPIVQGKKYDPNCKYIKKWIPELKNLTPEQIHKMEIKGKYLSPVIDHGERKKIALEQYKKIIK